jgi:hypothetical protein
MKMRHLLAVTVLATIGLNAGLASADPATNCKVTPIAASPDKQRLYVDVVCPDTPTLPTHDSFANFAYIQGHRIRAVYVNKSGDDLASAVTHETVASMQAMFDAKAPNTVSVLSVVFGTPNDPYAMAVTIDYRGTSQILPDPVVKEIDGMRAVITHTDLGPSPVTMAWETVEHAAALQIGAGLARDNTGDSFYVAEPIHVVEFMGVLYSNVGMAELQKPNDDGF